MFLKELANIRESLKNRTDYSCYNGKENISVSIYQQSSSSNLINLSKEVKRKLKSIVVKLPKEADADIKIISDQSDFIKKSLEDRDRIYKVMEMIAYSP